jgi:peptide/nickel transport system substrate-binding protein
MVDETASDGERPMTERDWSYDLGRRDFLRLSGASAMGVGLALAGCGGSSDTGAGKPKRGGTLRAGFSGGGSTDTMGGLSSFTAVSICYATCLYDSLVTYDADAKMHMSLAEEITPNRDATVWTIRLKPGVQFHSGKELTADDVIYTFQQIANPKSPQSGASLVSGIELAKMRKLDNTPRKSPSRLRTRPSRSVCSRRQGFRSCPLISTLRSR